MKLMLVVHSACLLRVVVIGAVGLAGILVLARHCQRHRRVQQDRYRELQRELQRQRERQLELQRELQQMVIVDLD